MKKNKGIFYLAFAIASLYVIFINSCDRNGFDDDQNGQNAHPTYEIEWVEEDLSDFVIYACDFFTDSLFVIDLATGNVKHQLKDFHRIASILTNHDGTRLYVSTHDPYDPTGTAGIYEIRTDSWERRKIYDNPAYLLSNNNGGVFFMTQYGGKSMRMFGEIDTDNGIAREIDSIDVVWKMHMDEGPIAIHPTEPILYARSPHEFYSFNYEVRTKTVLPFLGGHWFILSGGGDTLYTAGSVIDLVNLKKVSSIPVPYSVFYVAARRDNKEIYITAPARDRWSDPPGKVYIFSPLEDMIMGEIDAGYYVSGNPYPYLTTGRIYLTPGQRYAIVGDDWAAYYIIDLKDRKIVETKVFVKKNLSPSIPMQYFYLAPKPPGL